MTGDFNFNLLDFDKSAKVESFINLMFRYDLISAINKPAHVSRNSQSN